MVPMKGEGEGYGWGLRTLSNGTRELRVSICSAKELIELTVSLSVFSSACEIGRWMRIVRRYVLGR